MQISRSISLVFLLLFCLSFEVVLVAGKLKAEPIEIQHQQKPIYTEDFENDCSNWRAEFEQKDSSEMKIKEGKLDVVASHGATIWFKYKLKGNVLIKYHVTVVNEHGKYDRVSDMNVFWMATDPKQKDTIIRNGKFSDYDNLNLYYAGVGGHDNTYTRFRKYTSSGKPVLMEYTDTDHLLLPNVEYEVKIIVCNGFIKYYRNDVLFWEYYDTEPYSEGFFGFRTINSHQYFDNFKVYQLPDSCQ